MNAVDTNVLVYSLDAVEPVKHAKAKALLVALVAGSPPTILPWQVAGELLNWLRRSQAAGHLSAAEVDAHFQSILALFPLLPPSTKIFPKYFDRFSRFSLSHWDCMMLAACKEAGVTTLYSEDMDPGTDFDGIRVVNPFV
jgi:predicted nucleic acid-binding protein